VTAKRITAASIVVPITTAPSSKVWPTGLFAYGANMFGDNIAITHPVEPNWIAMDIGAICYAVRSIVRYKSSQCEMPNKAGGVTGHLTMPKAASTNGRTTHAGDNGAE
jgi:hypothetical protein